MSKNNKTIPSFPFANPTRFSDKTTFTREEMERMYEHLSRYIEELRSSLEKEIKLIKDHVGL